MSVAVSKRVRFFLDMTGATLAAKVAFGHYQATVRIGAFAVARTIIVLAVGGIVVIL